MPLHHAKTLGCLLACSTAIGLSAPAMAQTMRFNLPSEPARVSIPQFARQTGLQILMSGQSGDVVTPELRGEMDARVALQRLLTGTGLQVLTDKGGTIVLGKAPTGTLVRTAMQAPARPTPVAPAEPASAASREPVQIEEVVITAQRREENLQRAALAISAVSSADLERAGVTEVTALSKLMPSLQINNVGGPINAFYLRGVGNFTTSALSDPAIAVSIDGVFLGRPTLVQGVFFDLERIEVLKGPQGTLYGRNATGGAVNIITTKPKIGEFGGYANLEVGNFESVKASAAVNIPAGENGALRIAGQSSQRDGYYSDGSGDEDVQAVRVQYAASFGDVNVRLSADYAQSGGIGTGATLYGFDNDDYIGLHDPRAQARYANTFLPNVGDTLRPLTASLYQDNKMWGVSAEISVPTPLGSLTFLPAYRKGELDFVSDSAQTTSQTEEDVQWTAEARLVSDLDGPLSYILGVFYLNETTDTVGNFNQQYFATYQNVSRDAESYAAYGRLTYSVTERLRLTAGIRSTLDKKTVDFLSDGGMINCPGVRAPAPTLCLGGPVLPVQRQAPSYFYGPTGAVIPAQPFGPGEILAVTRATLNREADFRKVTYRAAVEYDLAEASLLYLAYETGFKSGGFVPSFDKPVFAPETITAFTIGSKNRFLDNRLQLNAEAFYWEYKDQQFSHFRTNTRGGVEFITENIGKSRIAGLEVEAVAQLTGDTRVSGSVQYLDAENVDFVYQTPALVGAPVSGCPISGPTAGFYTVNCNGARPVLAPEWTISAAVQHRVDLGGHGALVFDGSVRYQSEMFTGLELLATQKQKGYATSNIQVSYTSESERFTVAGFVDNLTDETTVGFSAPHPRTSALLIQNLRPPRTYGLRVGTRF